MNRQSKTFSGGTLVVPISEIRNIEIKNTVFGKILGLVEWMWLGLLLTTLIMGIAFVVVYWFFGWFSYYSLVPLLAVFTTGCAIASATEYFDKRISNILQLVTLSGTFKLIGKKRETEKARKILQKVRDNLLNDQHRALEEYTVAVPAIPAQLFAVLQNGLRRGWAVGGAWHLDVDDWVKEGEEIVSYYGNSGLFSSTTISIVAPFSGKMIMRGNTDVCHWSRETKSPRWDTDSEGTTTLVVIQPVKGSDTHNLVAKAYTQLLGFVSRFVKEPKKLKVSTEFDWQLVLEELELLKSTEARIIRR